MSLVKHDTDIEEVYVITPRKFPDNRGHFIETFHQRKYSEVGINESFVQDNHSRSAKGVIRGLHYQLKSPQAKLIYVITGEIIDVAVDIRKNSPTFGKFVSENLSAENCRQLFIPKGFAHGFCVLSDYADIIYKCSDFYRPGDDHGILWSDPDICINWPLENPIVSQKDEDNLLLNKTPEKLLPLFSASQE